MLGITKYFTTSQNTIGGVKKNLVLTPPKMENQELPPMEIVKRRQFMDIRTLDQIAFEKCDALNASELTITFREKFRNTYTDYEIKKIINKFLTLSGLEYILYPEYGKHTHLHYHGVIWGKRMLCSELLKELKNHFGKTTLGMIQKPENYKKYILKERDKLTTDEILSLTIFKIK